VALLSASVAAPIMGRLGDGPRRRETILSGLAIVFAGSVVAGVAHSLLLLVIGLPSVAGATAVGAGYPISGLIATDVGLHAAFLFGALISVLAFAAAAGMVTRAVAQSETGGAMGLYQVLRGVGFSIGSALAASIIAVGTGAAGQVRESGYITALWVGTVICALSALATMLLSRGHVHNGPTAADPISDRLAEEEGELASAGLVGIEGEQT
jgi:hypothetical protein